MGSEQLLRVFISFKDLALITEDDALSDVSSWLKIVLKILGEQRMGGCCCSSSGRAESDKCTPTLEEHEPASVTYGASSAVSAGMFIGQSIDTSSPDTYRAPPAPLPYDADLSCTQTLSRNWGEGIDKTDQVQQMDSQPVGETLPGCKLEGPDSCKDFEEPECKKTDISDDSVKTQKDEPSKVDERIVSGMDEEDVCPICLDEYDLENPRVITKCEHHFHLSCILEWMERSDTCAVCDQIMLFDHGLIE